MGRRGSRRPPRPGEEPEQVLFVASTPAIGGRARLEGAEADHAHRSLRLKTGDAVQLVDGRGGRFHGRVAGLGKRAVEVEVDAEERIPVWPARRIWLGAGVLRSTRMDFLVEKAGELGVERFQPLLLTRCVARPAGEGTKSERWHRLAVESLKQSRRARLLEILPPADLDGFLAALPPARTLWVADPEGLDPREAAREPGGGPLVAVVGPEGGLTPEERGILDRAGARFIRLGGHRLRAETAVVALLAAALATLGELGPDPAGA